MWGRGVWQGGGQAGNGVHITLTLALSQRERGSGCPPSRARRLGGGRLRRRAYTSWVCGQSFWILRRCASQNDREGAVREPPLQVRNGGLFVASLSNHAGGSVRARQARDPHPSPLPEGEGAWVPACAGTTVWGVCGAGCAGGRGRARPSWTGLEGCCIVSTAREVAGASQNGLLGSLQADRKR